MIGNRYIIDNKYRSIWWNKNLSAIISTYNVRFAREKVDMTTTLDKLALKYYGDESKWPVIAIWNGLIDIFVELDQKEELIIPLDIQNWVDKL